MNCFLVSFIVSYLAFSFGEELKILPPLRQYWVKKGSTLNLTCIHNGTQTSQEHSLSFWKGNTQMLTGNGVTVNTFAVVDTQDVTRTIRTLVITKRDVQFSDGVPYKCILGQNTSNFKGEAVIEVRVLEFRSAEYTIPDFEKKYLESIPGEEEGLIIECGVSGVNSRDSNFSVITQFLKASEGKEQILWNSSKYTIYHKTLEIRKPVREDAGEYRCLLIFNNEDKSSCQEVRSPPFYVKDIKDVESGGRGYMQDYLWTYILFLFWLLQCGLYAGPTF